MPAIDLDAHFRKGSAARTVAERLLTGKQFTRQELVRDMDVSVTTVNRVVDVLEEQGAVIERWTADDGRQTVFRLARTGRPKRQVEYPALNAPALLVRAELIGESVVIDFQTGRSTYRGALDPGVTLPRLGESATVVGVAAQDGQPEVTLRGDDGSPVVVRAVENITN